MSQGTVTITEVPTNAIELPPVCVTQSGAESTDPECNPPEGETSGGTVNGTEGAKGDGGDTADAQGSGDNAQANDGDKTSAASKEPSEEKKKKKKKCATCNGKDDGKPKKTPPKPSPVAGVGNGGPRPGDWSSALGRPLTTDDISGSIRELSFAEDLFFGAIVGGVQGLASSGIKNAGWLGMAAIRNLKSAFGGKAAATAAERAAARAAAEHAATDAALQGLPNVAGRASGNTLGQGAQYTPFVMADGRRAVVFTGDSWELSKGREAIEALNRAQPGLMPEIFGRTTLPNGESGLVMESISGTVLMNNDRALLESFRDVFTDKGFKQLTSFDGFGRSLDRDYLFIDSSGRPRVALPRRADEFYDRVVKAGYFRGTE